MRITIASGSLSAALGLAGTGVAWMFPEQRWLGALFIVFALAGFAVDIRIEHGSFQTKGRKMGPLLLMSLGIIVFFTGCIWQVYKHLNEVNADKIMDSTSNPQNNIPENGLMLSFDFPNRSQLGSEFTSLNIYFANQLDRDVIIRQIYLKQFMVKIPGYNGRQRFDYLCDQVEDFGPGDISAIFDNAALKIGENILGYNISPAEFHLDGSTREPGVFVISSKKSSVVLASFKTHMIGDEQNLTILCPKIQYIKKDGNMTTVNSKGFFIGILDRDGPFSGGKLFGAVPAPVIVH